MKILIVEDNLDDRKVLHYIIKAHGHEAIEAGNGQEGLEAAAVNKPDLIISDALMPVMDGFHFLRNIKQDADLRSIPFIFYSAIYEGELEKQLASSLGADCYIIKPKEPEAFWDEIEKIIGGKDKGKNIASSFIGEEVEYFKSYSQIVASKLEEKVIELEKILKERKKAEEQIIKLNRIYAVLSNINQAIVRTHETGKLLHESCRIAVESGKFLMVWIGLINMQTSKVDVAASYGVSGDYLENINIDLKDEKRSSGPTGKAIKTGKYKISNNILNDESMIPWRDNALMYGYKSSASFPLIVFGKVVGAFNVYSSEIEFFENDDIKLLDEMVNDISFAMEFIENETKRKQAEETLKESEERYRCLVEMSPDAIIIHQKGKLVFGNESVVKLMGAGNQSDILGKPILNFVHPSYRERVIHRIEETIEGRIAPVYEEKFIKLDGTEIDVEVSAIPFSYQGSAATQVIFRDITKRKHAEDALKFQNILLLTEHANSVDGIYIVDKHGEIINFNKRFFEIWGISQQKIDFHSSEMVMHEILDKLVDPEEFLSRIEYLNGNKNEKSGEEILFKDGRVIDRYSAPMIGGDGVYFGRVWNFRDITEKKVSMIKLQKSVEEKDILLRELYHRTKNNMQVICSMLVLKSSQIDDIMIKGIIDEIVAKIQTMAIVHQKLYESNDLSIINLSEYVKSITDIIINNNDLSGREILIHQSINDLPISIDTAMPLGLLLNELLINSVKHAFPGNRKGDIWIDLDGHADNIIIKYRDSGTGLPEGFDPDLTTTFGMKIVQDITRMQLGGEIKIFNDKGFNCHINIKTNLYRKRV